MDSRLQELIESIYAAAEMPAMWPSVLERISATLDCRIMLGVWDPYGDARSMHLVNGFDSSFVSDYNTYWHKKDPFIRRAQESPEIRRRLLAGELVGSHEGVPDAELRHTEVYNDLLLPERMRRGLCASLEDGDGVQGYFGIWLNPKLDEAKPRQMAILQHLMLHVRRAVRIQIALATSGFSQESPVARAGVGMLALSQDRRLLSANSEGERILRLQDGLALHRGKLRTSFSEDQVELDRALTDHSVTVVSPDTPLLLRMRRPSGRTPYLVMVSRVSREGILGQAMRSYIVLLVTDGERTPPSREQAIQVLLGVTAAQAAIIARLCEGKSPKEIAGELAVTLHTVRSHLRDIANRTGITGQANLIRVVVQATAGLP